MDFLRATVKALFVEFPINAIGFLFEEDESKIRARDKEGFLRNMLGDILRRTQVNFTGSNIDSLLQIIFDNWLIDDKRKLSKDISIENRLPLLPLIVGNKLLDSSPPMPRVKFENLLRWRDLTFHTSEDLMTIPAIANFDIANKVSDRDFMWGDTLSHDAEWINDILKEGLWDIHSHIASGADPSMLNWIILMNHPDMTSNLENSFKRPSDDADVFLAKCYDPTNPYSLNGGMYLSSWIKIAAWIRSELFSRLYGLKNPTNDWILSIANLDAAELNGYSADIFRDIVGLNLHDTEDFSTLPTFNNIHWDYAVNTYSVKQVSEEDKKSPYMLQFGERKLLYDFYKGYLTKRKGFIKMAKYVWLYLLIRNKFRREVVSTNTLIGFTNFKKYFLDRDIAYYKGKGTKQPSKGNNFDEEYDSILLRYAIQTSIGKDGVHGLEARMGMNEYKKLLDINFNKSIFYDQALFEKDDCNLSVVAQFTKNAESVDKKLSRQIKDHESLFREVVDFYTNHNTRVPKLVGVDTCSDELAARPYVFGKYYRKLTEVGIKNQTFHIGEDFHDIIDGLRAIDEAIRHLHFNNNLRFGHALALGLDIKRYYERRHFCAVLPRQVLLDNVVWIKFQFKNLGQDIPEEIEHWIETVFRDQLNEIGYSSIVKGITYEIYWDSIRFRGFSDDEALDKDVEADFTAIDEKSTILLDSFMDNDEISKKGSQAIETSIPKNIIDILLAIQDNLRKEIQARGIPIECNPTSNLVIGPFERYSEHPMFKMTDPNQEGDGSHINIAICTDNKGIMATSLENEYSLIAAAMSKPDPLNPIFKPLSKQEIRNYLEKIQSNSKSFRFSV